MKDLFLPVLSQMLYLFAFIAIGYLLVQIRAVPQGSETVLSKLENTLFLPATVMVTFMTDFTVERLTGSWQLLLGSFALALILIPVAVFVAKCCFREVYLQRITTYCLTFSNFGFMGLAVVPAAFPELELAYTVATLPFWAMIYAWGVPVLLISSSAQGQTVPLGKRLRAFANPMMAGMLIGLVLGLTGAGAHLPAFVTSALSAGKACMSPIAMLLTGMTVAKINIRNLLRKWQLYAITLIKLVGQPLLFLLICLILPKNELFDPTFLTCAFCITCMPAGLNAIVVPAGYGKDTSDAAGLALITHLLSVITIPLLFTLFTKTVL